MLIGREAERQLIEPLVAGARVGESGVLILTGDAGIGKTALLDWAATCVTGMRLLRATGIEAEQQVPFGGLLQLLRPILGVIDSLPAPQADALAGALALRAGGGADRFAVGAGTLGLICRAAEERPVALLIDDAHLLDRPSAEALAFAARRLLADQVLLLATARSDEPSALTEAGLPQVRIGGLDRAAAALVVQSSTGELPVALLDRMHRATGGNPLALQELSADPERLLRLPPDAPVPVPGAVARAVAAVTARLDRRARTVLLLAAASGGELPLVTRAAALLGVDALALQDAERADVVRVTGGRVVFRHPLVRSSVYAAADPDERRAAHRALAAALPGEDLERRAWHLAEAATGPDDQAADLLERVGVRARSRSADATAATAFERAARLSVDESARTSRLVSAGESAWLAGQGGRSGELLAEALAFAATPALRVRAQELLGAVAARSGSLTDARDRLSAAAREAAAFDADLAVVLLADVINACFYLGDSAGAMTTVRLLDELLPSVITVRARVLGLMAMGIARVLAGEGGMELIRRSVDLLGSSDELDDDQRRRAWLVLGPLFLRESGTGRELVQRAVEDFRQRAALGALPTLLFHLARDDATTDRWSAAASEYHEAIRLARESGQSTELAASLSGLGWLEARLGRWTDSRAHLDESAGLCSAHQINVFLAWTMYGSGDLALGLGSAEQALTHFQDLATFLESTGIRDIDISAEPEQVEMLLRLGRGDEARLVAEHYRDRAMAKGQPWAMARAERSRGLVGPDDELDATFAAALDWHAKTLDDFERARTLLAQGSRLRRARRRVDAREPLRAAVDVFDRLGAAPYAQMARGELQATGERAHRAGVSTIEELTPQELQIATMLADGRSTRETASALFLSPKTVEYHLRHVYTKLDVHSRDELGRKLSR